jgi:hypothetical protein
LPELGEARPGWLRAGGGRAIPNLSLPRLDLKR